MTVVNTWSYFFLATVLPFVSGAAPKFDFDIEQQQQRLKTRFSHVCAGEFTKKKKEIACINTKIHRKKLNLGRLKQSDWNAAFKLNFMVQLGSSPSTGTLKRVQILQYGKVSLGTMVQLGSADADYTGGRSVFTAAAVRKRTHVPNKPNERPVSSSVTGRCATERHRVERQQPETLETKKESGRSFKVSFHFCNSHLHFSSKDVKNCLM